MHIHADDARGLFQTKLEEAADILEELRQNIEHSHVRCEGNCFMYGGSTRYAPELLPKQINLFASAQMVETVVEIGFNAGHSCLLFLLANPISHIYVFDINLHPYTPPCLATLEKHFPGRITFIPGDSTTTLPKFIEDHPQMTVDLVHVDGSHDRETLISDIENTRKLCSLNTLVILDDDHYPEIKEVIQSYKDLSPVTGALPTTLYTHFLAHWTSV